MECFRDSMDCPIRFDCCSEETVSRLHPDTEMSVSEVVGCNPAIEEDRPLDRLEREWRREKEEVRGCHSRQYKGILVWSQENVNGLDLEHRTDNETARMKKK